MKRCSRVPLLLVIGLVCVLLSRTLHGSDGKVLAVEERWQTIWNQQQRVGYTHSTSSRKIVKGESVVQTDTLLSITMLRFGQSVTIRQLLHCEEKEDGTLLNFVSIMENPPHSSSNISGTVAGDVATIRSKIGATLTTKTLSGMRGVLSPVWQDRLVEGGDLKLGESREFDVFEPQLGSRLKVQMVYERDRPSQKDELLREIRIRQSMPGIPPIESVVLCSRDWQIQRVKTPLMQLELVTATEQTALEAIGEVRFDLAADTMVPVTGLTNSATAKSITYRIAISGVSPKSMQTLFREASHRQSIRIVDENSFELTVTREAQANRVSDATPNPATPNPASSNSASSNSASGPGAEFLDPSQYLESRTQIIQALARGATGEKHPMEVALQLEKFVKEYVSNKNFSTAMATAAEVAQTRAGDCTEHAMLLAALLRAREIPSRVAIGFVYSPSRNAFVGHMWTEAWVASEGKTEAWFPLDATSGRGGIGCGHLTISTSSLSDLGPGPAAEFLPMIHLLGRTQIDVIEERR